MEKEVRNSTKKMLMYFIVFSITMLFGGFISAYIVSSMGQYWVHITPPTMFVISNAIIVAASVALYLANRAIKAFNEALGYPVDSTDFINIDALFLKTLQLLGTIGRMSL